ncbi:MAG: Tat pathway signal protein [Proteobacteria bacterium]|nr:Tat pathway signal protein [Pseudomonadota bacterium]
MIAGLAGCVGQPSQREPTLSVATEDLLGDIERRTFDYFWASANPDNGLVPDSFPGGPFASIAAVGFALTAYPIAVERGYVSRAAAAARALTTIRFLHDAPQGPSARGFAGYHGFFYHFLDMRTGLRHQQTELSTIDTALLMAGVLAAAQYFDGSGEQESELRRLADELYRRVEWQWAADAEGLVALGWTPEAGYHPMRWRGYNEAMILYVLGLGSPSSPLPDAAWPAWASSYDRHWHTEYGQTYLAFPSLFIHQFSHVWIDFRGIRDDFMRAHGSDYFQNSRRATYAQQAYAIANPLGWRGYGATLFGLTACNGPGGMRLVYHGEERVFRGYAARGVGGAANYDDGTLAPTGAIASLPFAPEIVLPAITEMATRHGSDLYGRYGFVDAFNPSLEPGAPITQGHLIAGAGWFDDRYLGLDQGPIIAMVENFRSGLVWRLMRANPYVRRGLERAGFRGGWLGGD